MGANAHVEILDSTLRDGAQGEHISFSLQDKLAVVQKLDKQGIAYIEGGNPASNPKELEFFHEARRLQLQNAKLVAFGSTRHRDTTAQKDLNCQALLEAGCEVVSIFGKTWDLHVREILKTTLEENLKMIFDTVQFFKAHHKTVVFDAEHFFDGYKENPDYALAALQAAYDAGADVLCLCDTNGGAFPQQVYEATKLVCGRFACKVGIHCHNDCGLAVANSILAVQAGACHVQGTYLGFGERCGNANLSTIIPDLQLKLGYTCIPQDKMQRLCKTAMFIAETANILPDNALPYVGASAFSHKAGMHIDGVKKVSRSFEHIDPSLVGNQRNLLISQFAGKSAVFGQLSQWDHGLRRDDETIARFVSRIKDLEAQGYEFESAAASTQMLALKHLGRYTPFFELEFYKILAQKEGNSDPGLATAVVKIRVKDRSEIRAAEGEGPVNALDLAMRKAIELFYPQIARMRLVDYKVRVLEAGQNSASRVRVLIQSSDGENVWTTVGVSFDIIHASWEALCDSIEYKLLKDQVQPL